MTCIHCDNWGCSRCGRTVGQLLGRVGELEVECTRRAQDAAELRQEVTKLTRLLVDAVADRDRARTALQTRRREVVGHD